ncbi:ATP citrate synthase [Candidatus Nomurabacteria bacterium]|nr:ATP citrate synthase [Candidatus Nomurabacteria bacterium]
MSKPFQFDYQDQVIVYGQHKQAIQTMLDYDNLVKKQQPSIVAVIDPFGGTKQVYKWGKLDILLPTFRSVDQAIESGLKARIGVNMASSRSAYQATLEMLKNKYLKLMAILAEGVSEREARKIAKLATEREVTIIGPASVGALIAGKFKISHAGGTIDNVLRTRLDQPGSVGLISKSGGMLNELMTMIDKNSDGVTEAIAVGGDRYPASRLVDHLARMIDNPRIRLIVILGEIGGIQENQVAKYLKDNPTDKVVICHIIGSGSRGLNREIQFGHAGAKANQEQEMPDYKLARLEEAGVLVVRKYQDLAKAIRDQGVLDNTRSINHYYQEFNQAIVAGDLRYTPSIISTVDYDYQAGSKQGFGEIIADLWLQRPVKQWQADWIELAIKLIIDHGPLVSGAHNTIVTARAGKDLASSLASGLLTIGPRFGGAITGAATYFSIAVSQGLSPEEFVSKMKQDKVLIPGIGHLKYSRTNPDLRTKRLIDFLKSNLDHSPHLDFALEVENITLRKKDNLVLNVDGALAVCLLDIMQDIGIDQQGIQSYIQADLFNGFFIWARSMGLIAHHIDQKLLNQPLYRHPEWDNPIISNPQ